MPRFNVPPSWQQHLPNPFFPAADWQPDPSWGIPPAGWVLWSDEVTGQPTLPPKEYAQNAYLNVSTVPGPPNTNPTSPLAPTETKKPLNRRAKIGIGIGAIVLFGAIVGSCGGGDEQPSPAASTPEASETPTAVETSPTTGAVAAQTDAPSPSETEEEEETTPEPVEEKAEVKLPTTQQAFSDQVATTSKKYDGTDNELKASKLIIDRDKALCSATGGTFKGWKATVNDVGSTGDGYGYISLIMPEDIELATWNNALSDAFDNTLIKPENKLYDVLTELSTGDEVTVGGTFIKGENSCVSTSNLTEVLNASSPDFTVDFSSIKAD